MLLVGRLLLLFILIPLIDTLLLVTQIGPAIGAWNTILLVVATGALGAWLTKLEGGRAWRAWQRALSRGQMPEEGVLGGLLLLLGSALLITPGVVTDVVGFLLLIAPTRRLITKLVRARLENHIRDMRSRASEGAAVRIFTFGGAPASRGGRRVQPDWEQPQGERKAEREAERDAEREEEPEVIVSEPRRRVRKAPIRRRPRAIIDADFEVSEPS